MKIPLRFHSVPVFLAAFLLAAGALRAADKLVRYEAQPGSKIKIEGTSTIHDWTVETAIIGGFMELDAEFDADLKTLKVKPKVEVTIPARSLKSGKKPMDTVMLEAMKSTQFPKIEYRLLDMAAKDAPKTAAGGYAFTAKGALTVCGVTRTNTMVLNLERVSKTQLKVTGTTAVKMTDFGIKPPAPEIALGLIKTGDDVKLTIEWVTSQPADAPKAP